MKAQPQTSRSLPDVQSTPWTALASGDRPVHCPVSPCGGTLLPYSTTTMGYDPVTGLETWGCATCGHQGMRARQDLRILFSDRREYLFSYGPSLATVAIHLCAAAVTLFARHHVSPVQVATYVAEWTLLTGRVEGTIQLSLETAALADCYKYFRRHVLHDMSAQIAERSHQ